MTRPLDPAMLGTVLGVWAHPDDETFLAAGLTAAVTDAGGHVSVVTATLGEHGTEDPRRWPPTRLARRRAHELRASLAVVGVRDHRLLGFEDGTLASVPVAVGVRHVLDAVARVRPDTIVTFGPDGLTGHPDHVAVAGWVRAARPLLPSTTRVLHATTTAEFAHRFADANTRTRSFYRDDLPLARDVDDLALCLRLTGDDLDRKLAALSAHASQVGRLVDLLGEDTLRDWWAVEAFVLAEDVHASAWSRATVAVG